MPIAIDEDACIQPTTTTGTRSRKKGCSICSSASVLSRVEVMARRCNGGAITYCTETRCFCSKHTPPPNLVSSGRFIDERQLMEFCHLKDSNRRGCH